MSAILKYIVNVTSTFKFYLTPLLSLLVGAGILAGGHWLWFGFLITTLILVIGDAFLGEELNQPNAEFSRLLQGPLFLSLPIMVLVLLALSWSASDRDIFNLGLMVKKYTGIDILLRRDLNSMFDYFGAILGVGLLLAGYGTNSAHELTHQYNSRIHYWTGRWILSLSLNADFAIEHVFGHHFFVGTKKDPATAQRGENVYSFFIRSTFYGHLSAWNIEIARLRKLKLRFWSFSNQMLTGIFMSLVWMGLLYYLGGPKGLLLFLGQAFVAKFVLEVTNYMEHYGLIRSEGETVKPEHSWNTNRKMSYLILYSLVRHSAHHERARVPFWKLNPYPSAPEMAQGYLTTIFICLIPPIWFRIMEPKLNAWDAKYRLS